MNDARGVVADRTAGLAAASIFFGLASIAIQIRMEEPWSDGALFALAAVTFVVIYALALAAPAAFDRPTVDGSVLIVVALLLAPLALLQLSRVLGVDDPGAPGTLTWMSAAYVLIAAVPAARRGSAIATLLAAAGVAGVVLAGATWLFDLEGESTYRYLLTALAVGFFAAGLTVGGSRPRHGVVLVDAAGLAAVALGVLLTGVFFIGAFFGEGPSQPWGWQLMELLGGLALAGYAASNREPGPGYLSVAVLAQFVFGVAISFDDDPSITGWPLALLIIGAVILAATLRPRGRR
jgi:peptidoglycan/LPS O-acetylase OafA/YrhL